jgi:transcriptional regulator with XRE-family HTH domain
MTKEEFREFRGPFTQYGISLLLGVTQGTVSKWESGKRPIPKWVDKFAAMAKEYYEHLLSEENERGETWA